jgi:hypothetical protein
MINIWLDWNCIIGLERERDYSPALRQIREWYNQGKLVLCTSSTIRMEKHPSPNKTYFDENELNEKLRDVGLEGIEIRSPKPRFFNLPSLQPILIREIHDRIFPTIVFSTRDHAEKLRHMGRKWMNQKNDALSIYTFATWSVPDDVFVSADYDDVIEKGEALYAPYKIWVDRLVEVPTDPNVRISQKRREEISGHIVIPGQILDPQEAEEYLRKRLDDYSEK